MKNRDYTENVLLLSLHKIYHYYNIKIVLYRIYYYYNIKIILYRIYYYYNIKITLYRIYYYNIKIILCKIYYYYNIKIIILYRIYHYYNIKIILYKIYYYYHVKYHVCRLFVTSLSLETFARNVRSANRKSTQGGKKKIHWTLRRHGRQKDKQRFVERFAKRLPFQVKSTLANIFVRDFCDKFRPTAVGTVTYCKIEENTANGFRRSHVLASCVRESHP